MSGMSCRYISRCIPTSPSPTNCFSYLCLSSLRSSSTSCIQRITSVISFFFCIPPFFSLLPDPTYLPLPHAGSGRGTTRGPLHYTYTAYPTKTKLQLLHPSRLIIFFFFHSLSVRFVPIVYQTSSATHPHRRQVIFRSFLFYFESNISQNSPIIQSKGIEYTEYCCPILDP